MHSTNWNPLFQPCLVSFTENPTCIDAEALIEIKTVKFTENLDKVTPGSEIKLLLQIDSHFPQDLPIENLAVSLSHFDTSNASMPEIPEEENVVRRRIPRVLKQKSNS